MIRSQALGLTAVLSLCLTTAAQDPSGVTIPPGDSDGGFPGLANRAPKVEIPWNRLVDTAELYARMDRLAEAYPGFLGYEVIGHSVEGRELRVYTLTAPGELEGDAKPAMWIDGNIHGNEVQGGEAVVYTAWYLLENYGHNARVTDLVDRAAFYLLPSLNPDGRDSWFHEAHTASSSRSGVQPVDSDRDGAFDEDGPNDLDGDGSIVQMRKHVPGEGTHRLDEDDPRIMVPMPRDSREKGDWILLGSEGIDDDGDGRFNEDGRGGYDMNRSWPSYWMPEHIQFGAGPYPLYWPETRSVARFVMEHPNVAAFQTFHNSGGMILRGPGTESFGEYPRADLAVFDALGQDGEKLLPFYNYMIIWKDLYSVYGGEATWAYESLGIISFTNELWTGDRMNPDGRLTGRGEDRHWSDDHLLMGAGFVDWHPFDHPFYGEIELGGFRKDVGRVPPSFLIEEMLHRNALFNIRHAEAMPRVEFLEHKTTELPGGLVALDVTVSNRSTIPTRTAQAAAKGIGVPDRLTIALAGRDAQVLAAGYPGDRWHPERIALIDGDPTSIALERGVPGEGDVTLRWILSGGSEATIRWTGEKALDVETTIEL
ncbi:MAG: M14 family metallopeptidase [Planctomycetota bacterium]|nr:M14 family metallopeptidase [Planctomycetota bacterium]